MTQIAGFPYSVTYTDPLLVLKYGFRFQGLLAFQGLLDDKFSLTRHSPEIPET